MARTNDITSGSGCSVTRVYDSSLKPKSSQRFPENVNAVQLKRNVKNIHHVPAAGKLSLLKNNLLDRLENFALDSIYFDL